MVFHEAFCYITWMPEKVPAVVKARISTHQVGITDNECLEEVSTSCVCELHMGQKNRTRVPRARNED